MKFVVNAGKNSLGRKTQKKRTDPFCLRAFDQKYAYPPKCPVCKKGFKKGFAELSGGALALSKDKRNDLHLGPDRHLAFLSFHVHECWPDTKRCADGPDENVVIDVVNDYYGGQFDLGWCSLACMRKWILKVLDELESSLQAKMDSLRRKALKS